MKTSTKFKAMRASLLALTLATAALPLWGETTAAKKPAYTPRISADANAAFYYRKNTSPIGKLLEGVNELPFKFFTENTEDTKRMEKFFADSGLKGQTLRWAVASTSGEFKTSGRMGMFDLSVVFAVNHDPERVAKAFTSVLDEEIGQKLVETTVAGVKAWQVTSEEHNDLGVEQYFASLDGQLIFMATGKELLAKEIALYKEKGKTSKAFEKLVSEKSAIAGVYVRDLGKEVGEFEKIEPGVFAGLDQMVPNGSKIFTGAKSLVVKLTAGKNGASLTGLLTLKDENDANTLKSVADMMLMPLSAQFSNVPAEAPEEMKLGAEILKGLTLTAKKNTLVLRVPFSEAAIKGMKKQLDSIPEQLATEFGSAPEGGSEGFGE